MKNTNFVPCNNMQNQELKQIQITQELIFNQLIKDEDTFIDQLIGINENKVTKKHLKDFLSLVFMTCLKDNYTYERAKRESHELLAYHLWDLSNKKQITILPEWFNDIPLKFYVYISKNGYHFILRSVSQKNYIMNESNMYDYFSTGLNELFSSKLEFNFRFYLEDLNNDIIAFNFTFHNKRRYFKINNIIISEPWLIKYEALSDKN